MERVEEKEKKKIANEIVKKDSTLKEAVDADMSNGEDECDIDDDPSFSTKGKTNYQNMLKSMIARIEADGRLARIQEYGRHQQKGVRLKKKTNKRK